MPPYRKRSCVLFFGHISKWAPRCFFGMHRLEVGTQFLSPRNSDGICNANHSVSYCVGPNGPWHTMTGEPANTGASLQACRQINGLTHAHRASGLQNAFRHFGRLLSFFGGIALPNLRHKTASGDKEERERLQSYGWLFQVPFFERSVSHTSRVLREKTLISSSCTEPTVPAITRAVSYLHYVTTQVYTS